MRSLLRASGPLRRIVLPILAGLLALIPALNRPAHAEPATYLINEDSGYGISDCFSGGLACGRNVADAWCEAHGRGVAVAYGLADDVTGAIAISVPASHRPGDVVIRCGE